MPLGQLQLNTLAVLTPQIASQVVERGTLVALSATWPTPPPPWAQCYVQIGLSSANAPIRSVSLVLAAGYLDFADGPQWSGHIALTPGTTLVLVANTAFISTITLAWITED